MPSSLAMNWRSTRKGLPASAPLQVRVDMIVCWSAMMMETEKGQDREVSCRLTQGTAHAHAPAQGQGGHTGQQVAQAHVITLPCSRMAHHPVAPAHGHGGLQVGVACGQSTGGVGLVWQGPGAQFLQARCFTLPQSLHFPLHSPQRTMCAVPAPPGMSTSTSASALSDATLISSWSDPRMICSWLCSHRRVSVATCKGWARYSEVRAGKVGQGACDAGTGRRDMAEEEGWLDLCNCERKQCGCCSAAQAAADIRYLWLGSFACSMRIS